MSKPIPFPDRDPTRTLLRQILAEIQALRVEVRAVQAHAPDAEDLRTLTQLLPLAFAGFGEREFSVRDLDELADEVPGHDALRAMLDSLGNKRVGRLLARNPNVTANGLRVVFVRTTPEGKTYRLSKSL